VLTKEQAAQIVRDSIIEVKGKGDAPTLTAAGFALMPQFVGLITSGVRRYQHVIDPNSIADIDLGKTTPDDLGELIRKISVGKICSNPASPHPQKYPYPANCPDCGYAVL
jgi:hypothetical protein